MPKLTRYYTLIGLLSMTLAAFGFSYAYHRFEHDRFVETGQTSNLQFGKIFINTLWDELAAQLDELRILDNSKLRQHATIRKIGQVIRTDANHLDILQLGVYLLDGKAIFSTELSYMDEVVEIGDHFKQAMNGATVSWMENKDIVNGLDGMKLDRYVVTTYLPVIVNKDSDATPDVLIKIVSDVSSQVFAKRNTETLVYFAIGLIFFTNFVLLVMAIRRVNAFLAKQTLLIEKQQQHIEHRYFHDSLTQLPKLKIFYDRLINEMETAVASEYLLAVLAVDLDRLQKINDTLGYKYGDQLLVEASSRLRQCVRKGDVISRLGGDKFILLVTQIHVIHEVEEIVDHIREAISEPYIIADSELFVSPSIGISVYPFSDDDAESLINKANSAMHKAKSTGKNIARFFNPGASRQAASRFSIENALRYALERDEFELHYQPVISLLKSNVCALEALLRWRSPQFGLVAPLEFIPLLEDTGLIMEVGNWVLEQACKDAVIWHQSGFEHLKMNINVSAVQFMQKEILRQVDNAISATGISPYLLDLEITESLLIDGMGDTIKTLEELNEMGIALSIDDFGTGYSSLAYLKRLPINTLKIDRSFIREVHKNIDDAAIIDAICALSRSLRFNVLVEGVETPEQLAFLRGMQVSAVQGYLFSRPLRPEDVYAFLRQGIHLDQLDPAV